MCRDVGSLDRSAGAGGGVKGAAVSLFARGYLPLTLKSSTVAPDGVLLSGFTGIVTAVRPLQMPLRLLTGTGAAGGLSATPSGQLSTGPVAGFARYLDPPHSA